MKLTTKQKKLKQACRHIFRKPSKPRNIKRVPGISSQPNENLGLEPWGYLIFKQQYNKHGVTFKLTKPYEQLKYEPKFNLGNEKVIVDFINHHDHFIISYINDMYINNQLIKKNIKYRIEDHDKIKIHTNKEILNFDIKINNKDTKLIESIKGNLMCKMCNNIYINPVALFPCFHTFCVECTSKHHKYNSNCFTCKQRVAKAQSNLVIKQLCDQFNNKKMKFVEPCFDKKEDELVQLEGFIKKYFNLESTTFNSEDIYSITFKRNRPGIKAIDLGYNINNKEHKLIELNLNNNLKCDIKVDINSYNQYTNSRDKIKHNYKCSYCLPVNNNSRFQCNYNTKHMSCRLCNNHFPEDLNKSTCCSLCDVSYCSYCYDIMNSLGHSLPLLNWMHYQPTNFPKVWFDGNSEDSQIFDNYIKAQHVSPARFYQTMVEQVKSNNLFIQDFKFKRLNIDNQVCNPCARQVFNELAFHFRIGLTNAKLAPYQQDPKEVKQDCYYGRYCKHKLIVKDNGNYNHACHPDLVRFRRRDAKLTFRL